MGVLLPLLAGLLVGAVVGAGGTVWYMRRKAQQMQENMLGGLDGLMGGVQVEESADDADDAPESDPEPEMDMEQMVGDVMAAMMQADDDDE